MEWLLSRTLIILLEVLGGLFAGLASLSKGRGASTSVVRKLSIASYAFMGASMVLFIVVGLTNGS